uniref:Uncharacterized protein n=1 Tax=Anopheles atroparvus TaxID=41427 RepID=A0A240PMS0_ANOAO
MCSTTIWNGSPPLQNGRTLVCMTVRVGKMCKGRLCQSYTYTENFEWMVQPNDSFFWLSMYLDASTESCERLRSLTEVR